jgi:hypothetical protein
MRRQHTMGSQWRATTRETFPELWEDMWSLLQRNCQYAQQIRSHNTVFFFATVDDPIILSGGCNILWHDNWKIVCCECERANLVSLGQRGSQSCQPVVYIHESCRHWDQESLCWPGPPAIHWNGLISESVAGHCPVEHRPLFCRKGGPISKHVKVCEEQKYFKCANHLKLNCSPIWNFDVLHCAVASFSYKQAQHGSSGKADDSVPSISACFP